MVKNKLMLGAAFAALGMIPSVPALAQSDEEPNVTISSDWTQTINVNLNWDVSVVKSLAIVGAIILDGTVESNALAQATLDDKQIVDQNEVQFEDYQNSLWSGRLSDGGPGPFSEPSVGNTAAGAHPATYDNTVTSGADTLANASGNAGLNMAAGDYNLQENAAVLSSASTNEGSGAAEAGSFSLQALYDNGFNNDFLSEETENTVINNSVDIGSGTANGASGNIGINGAAGAFNIQKNALVIATVNGGYLAEATAGTEQYAKWNDSVHEDIQNDVNVAGSLQNVSGNIGANFAAGVGNMQLNSLTIANALVDAGSV
jgi:hypothetical protein